jgi:exosortase E/protease (VPEID-CTERM system)
LILVFTIAWLAFFRRELRFPQALLLIPAGVAILWSLNVLRITALILIGAAGAPAVAVGGFHSAAGWICFNAVAFGLSLVAQRLPWFTGKRTPPPAASNDAIENPSAAYLIPFLAILAAAMIGRASSGGFEWLYPLRFFAAGTALWVFRDKYSKLDWSFDWLAPAVGVAVFGVWMALESFHGAPANSTLGTSLAALPAAGRIAWIAFRILAAVITVPVAEELAFRGFLMRRLISADFESVGLHVFRISAVLISSLAFGALHGDRWIAGAIAGLLYAGAQMWRGRIGDAILAHGVTNALIAAWVLYSGQWNLW